MPSPRRQRSPRHSAAAQWAVAAACAAAACATTPTAPPVPVPVVTWEQKLGWIVRLEDQRLLRDPDPPPPVTLRPAAERRPAIVAPPPPSDLLQLLGDPEPRVRRRAALAAGRVGLAEAVPALTALAADPEPEVRQMAAFAQGLLGRAASRPVLAGLLADRDPWVQGRAAEALGLIGDRADAAAISAMVREHIGAGALAGIDADEETYPLAPPAEAVRLGLFALARLGDFDALWAAVAGTDGQPVSRWWPVAYALQRVGDVRAAGLLHLLASTPGRYTASFAVRGLAGTKAPQAAGVLRQLIERRQAHPAVIVQALRGWAAIGDASLVPVLVKIVADAGADPAVRAEAMASLAAVATAEHADLLVDLLGDPSALVRAAAARALARVDGETFMLTLSGLEPDRDWRVRAAVAAALGTIEADRSLPLLSTMVRDQDQRVVPSAIAALAALKTAESRKLVFEQLSADDFAVRAAAAAALADLGAVDAVPRLIEAYRGAVGDSTYVARAAMLTALSRLDAEAARPVLREALSDREWAVRVRAASLLREQGGADGVDQTIRPAAPAHAVDSPEWRALVTPQYSPLAYIETEAGTIEIELAVVDAPLTVRNFVTLARAGFFNGLAVHRVVPDFVVQGGDPRGDGEGGPGHTIRDEINQRPYLRGTVGMALDWRDTGGSQFFITHSPQPHLDARYTVFGRVVRGMDVVDRLAPGDRILRVRIWDGVSSE